MFRLALLCALVFVVCPLKSNNFVVTRERKERILDLSADEAFDLFFESYQASGHPIFQEDHFTEPPDDYRSNKDDRFSPAEKKEEDYRPDQKASRRKIFDKAYTAVKAHNKKYLKGRSRYKTTVNAFSIMDDAEKAQYLGFVAENQNISEVLRNKRSPDEDEENTTEEVLSWRAEGYINEPYDQGSCLSCWTYPAAALVEFALKTTSGTLPRLSTQQLLDCTYEHVDGGKERGVDRCESGGHYAKAWEYLKMSQHSTTDSSYGYVGQDNQCQLNSNQPNEIQAKIRIDGYKKVGGTAGAFIEQLKISPIAVGIVIESPHGNDLHGYDQGMYDGCQLTYTSRTARGNLHAMLVTGYGPDYWELRNSWGADWGEQGFMKWYRGGQLGTSMCLMMRWGYTLQFTDITDGIGIGTTIDETTTEMITTEPTTEPKEPTTKPTTELTTTMPITTSEDSSGGSTDDCWIQNTAGHHTTRIKRTRFTSYHDCIDACRARESCKMVSVSPRTHHDRYCLLLKSHSQTRSRTGWKSAKRSCFRAKSHVGPAECTDNAAYASSCPGWAGSGHCESRSYKDWMTVHCSKSCQFCEDDGGGGGGPMKCEDVGLDAADCGHWASIGYCTDDDFRMFMRNSCPKTCEICI